MIREFVANSLISAGRWVGEVSGLQLAVEVSDHSITTEMEQPDKSNRAWDLSLFKHGNIFLKGYAVPIKPVVNHNDGLENPDTAEIREGETPESEHPELPEGEDSQPEEEPQSATLISSSRYQDYMRQELISQLLTPEDRWNKMLYGLIGLMALQFLAMIIQLYTSGQFA